MSWLCESVTISDNEQTIRLNIWQHAVCTVHVYFIKHVCAGILKFFWKKKFCTSIIIRVGSVIEFSHSYRLYASVFRQSFDYSKPIVKLT